MNALLAGAGQIGRAVFSVFQDVHQIDIIDYQAGYFCFNTDKKYDILLITFPYDENFIDNVRSYQQKYNIEHTLIFSTVPIGTCSQLNACHCPIEGKHPNLTESILITDKWLGGNDPVCEQFLTSRRFKVHKLPKPEYTEFLKLRSTTLYGLNIEFARYTKNVCDDLDLDFEYVKQWDQWVNDLYKSLGMNWAQRYILNPPNGPKGGHCVTTNAKILNKQYPNILVKIVAEEENDE